MTEVLWDPVHAEERQTVDPPGDRMVVHVGPHGGWRPAHLVTLAAASCFITVLLHLADDAGIPILGYVWNSKLRVSVDGRKPPTLTLSPCLVVATADHAAKLEALCTQAAESSTVCRLLRGRLVLVPDIQVVAPFDGSPDE